MEASSPVATAAVDCGAAVCEKRCLSACPGLCSCCCCCCSWRCLPKIFFGERRELGRQVSRCESVSSFVVLCVYMNVRVFLQRKAFVVGPSRRSAGGSTVSGSTVVCLRNTAKYSSCCWEDISDSSVLNTARSPGSRCESVSSLVVLCGHMNVHGSTVSGSTVVCIQNTAKYSCCCWEGISDSSVLNTLPASRFHVRFLLLP